MTFTHQTSYTWDGQSWGREAYERSPIITLIYHLERGGTQKCRETERSCLLELVQISREKKAMWHREPWRPADLSPADSHTSGSYPRTGKKDTRMNTPCGLHKLGDYSCSYKSELQDSQWSYKIVKCLIFKEWKPHNPWHKWSHLSSWAKLALQ